MGFTWRKYVTCIYFFFKKRFASRGQYNNVCKTSSRLRRYQDGNTRRALSRWKSASQNESDTSSQMPFHKRSRRILLFFLVMGAPLHKTVVSTSPGDVCIHLYLYLGWQQLLRGYVWPRGLDMVLPKVCVPALKSFNANASLSFWKGWEVSLPEKRWWAALLN